MRTDIRLIFTVTLAYTVNMVQIQSGNNSVNPCQC